MKKAIWMIPLLALATACSKADEQSGGVSGDSGVAAESAQSEVSDATKAGSAPDISPDVAPGVAFDFSYEFGLPEARIAGVQEQHAALCGKLGITQCRVTGLTFNKERDGGVSADMSFKLNPALALRFSKDATDLVEEADGRLDTSFVKGEDVGSGIVAGDKSAAAITAELAKIDAQLKIPALGKAARAELVSKASGLRDELASLSKDRDAKVESLATAPVHFSYQPSETIWGMDRTSPLQQGLSAGAGSFAALASFLALMLGYAGPWLLIGGLAFWLVQRWRRKPAPTPDHPA